MSVGRFVVVSLVVLDHEEIAKSKIENGFGFGFGVQCANLSESSGSASTEGTC
jgi:hypothetical protein